MKRNLSIDILKIIMAFLIICLHGNFLTDVNGYLGYVFVNGLSRIAVPTFLIVSGFYFYEVNSKEKFIKWIKRLFYLYSIWFIIYAFFWYSPGMSVLKIANRFIVGPYHLWYLIESLFAYIILWALKKTNNSILILLGVLFVFAGLFLQYDNSYSFLNRNILTERVGNSAYRNTFFFCFPFILLGYLINKFSITSKNIKPGFLILAGFLFFLEASINYMYSKSTFDILISLYIFCPLLFIWVYNSKIISNNKNLSYYSTGIYLTQMIFFLLPINSYLNVGNSLYVILVLCASILFSFILIQLNKKLKYII
jgi:surface polysaccharide O-acyltransferase-like enzyme